MDLSYGKEYEDFRLVVRQFLEANWPPKGDEADLDFAEKCDRFRGRAIEAGYLARSIPKKYGGSEQPADSLQASVIAEEFARVRAPGDIGGIGTMMFVPTLLEKGEEWQKEKFVEDTVRGRIAWCQGYSEPGSGSDLASLKTKGELIGDEWVINGQKIWTTSAKDADYMFCLVRTEPEEPKHGGISYLLIPMDQPGIEVRPLKQMTGGADFNEVFFTDAKTPKDWIVGKRGEGWLVSRATLKHERNGIGNAARGKQTLAGLVNLARSARRAGKTALEDTEVRQRLASIEGYMLAHQYSQYFQLTRGQNGGDAGKLGLMNKINSTNISHEVSKLALDLLDEDGLVDPNPDDRILGKPDATASSWITQYMYSLGVAVAGGTANIQRNVIGERGLGLPRDSWAQRSAGK
jgi:alkylation response protein AidB-like acyl-CoA dehydrogenase